MAESYDYLGDINTKKIWKLLSKFNEKEVQSIEMILQDNKGNRMIASIPKAFVQKWNGLIVQFQIITLNHIQELSFPLETFRFRIIVELLNTDKIHQSDLFEVVGKKDLRNLVTTKEKETKRLVVVLEDLEHNKIDYILFEKMVDKIFPHLEDGTVKPVIVLLQFFKAIWWNSYLVMHQQLLQSGLAKFHYKSNGLLKDPLRLLEPLLLLTLIQQMMANLNYMLFVSFLLMMNDRFKVEVIVYDRKHQSTTLG
ncbi:hypothetical protein AHAS_Ahas11G0085700 [Arachis hypogaea]